MDLPDSLITTLSENSQNLLPIIGAGVSMSIKDIDNETIFPSWKGLLEDAAEKIRNENDIENAILVETFLRKNDYQEAAKYAYEGLKNGLWHNFIKEKFDPDLSTLDPMSSGLSKAIWKISNKIITLNYDRTLTWAHPTDSAGVEIITNSASANLPSILNESISPTVWHLHGHVNDTAKLILTPESYSKLYPTSNKTEIEYKAALQVLKTVLSTKSLLFIGCSLDDADLLSEMTSQHNIFSGNCNPHYALIKESNKQEIKTKLKDTNVTIITFSDYGQPLIDTINKIASHINKDSSPAILSKRNNSKTPTDAPKTIAYLSANPIGHNTDYQPILKELKKLPYSIECLPLTIDNLQSLSKYEYIFISTTSIKNRLIIEDEYYCLDKIDIIDLQNNSDLCDKKAVVIFTDNAIDKKECENIKFPLLLLPTIGNTTLKGITSSIAFQLFKKKNIDYYNEAGLIVNRDKFELPNSISQSNNKIIKFETKLPNSIDKNINRNFTGRYEDLVSLTRKIAKLEEDNGFITIKGSGGLGKTTIAKYLALKLSEKGKYKGGIFFIDCEHLINLEQFKFHIASPFNLERSQNIENHISEGFDNESRLIILDNFEPLLHLDDKHEIIELLNFMSEYSSIVITSREFIKVDGEIPYTLRQMTLDEALELFRNGLGKRTLSPNEEKLVKDKIIDELLDKNPLAIKIITANILPNKNLHSLYEELKSDFFNISEEDLDLFDNSTDVHIDRKKSIYGSILYSYEMLHEDEKVAFEKLSLFPDGINTENFKKLNRLSNKNEKNIISDRVLKKLQNKSLIQEHHSDIKLQSIIGRFAERMFSKRDHKTAFYNTAFTYNHNCLKSLFNLCIDIDIEKNTLALKFYDKYINNILKSLSYIDKTTDNNDNRINFINLCSDAFIKTCSLSNFIELLNEKLFIFSKTHLTAIKSAIEYCRYFNGEFEDSFKNFQKLVPLNSLNYLDLNNNIELNIYSYAYNLYSMEGYQAYMFINTPREHFERNRLENGLKLGILIDDNSGLKDSTYFEKKYISNDLKLVEIDEYLDKLHKKQHIVKMQAMYIRSKLKTPNRESIDKLVVINPFTLGIKNLILAFAESDIKTSESYYLKSIQQLVHIKYYYVEAIYMYSKFLKQNNFHQYNETYNEGYNLSKKHCYRYLEYLYDELENPTSLPYDQKKYPQPDIKSIIDMVEDLS